MKKTLLGTLVSPKIIPLLLAVTLSGGLGMSYGRGVAENEKVKHIHITEANKKILDELGIKTPDKMNSFDLAQLGLHCYINDFRRYLQY